MTTYNGLISYRGLRNMTISVGMNNILDQRPPDNGRAIQGFDTSTYGASALGRFAYVRIRREF